MHLSLVFLLWLFYLINSIIDIKELGQAQSSISKLEADMLMLRRNEKDFILRKNLKYKIKFEKNVNVLKKDAEQLQMLFNSQSIYTDEIISFTNIINQYKSAYFKLVKQQEKIGLHPKDGLYGSLRGAVHKVQDSAKKSQNSVLLSSVYDLRKQEKDFMLRRDLKYVTKFKKKIDKLISISETSIKNNLQIYKSDFLELVDAEIEIGLDSKSGLQGEMRRIVHKSETILKNLLLHSNENIHKHIDTLNAIGISVTIFLIILIFLLSIIISKNILKTLDALYTTILDVSQSNNTTNRIQINSHDEIGIIAKEFNIYLDNIDKAIKEDLLLIEEAENVMQRVSNGWYEELLTKSTANVQLNTLKENINKMILNTKERFLTINSILEQYSNQNYLNPLVIQGIEKNGVFDVFTKNINVLQKSITNMLIENKKNGLTLATSSQSLLNNVYTLNKNANDTSTELEETAASLEEITANISNNTQNVIKMSNFAKELTTSTHSGQELAKQTSISMIEIDTEVNAINEAITVIDQISFQTNILSLNAAVEAATAGEAGKGFAVVAQEVRNLASRSAEAANEIKSLVENATVKANQGKEISDKMILGYDNLTNNIINTTAIIKNVENASKEQLQGIEQINQTLTILDKKTHENAVVATKTNTIAIQTDTIATLVVSNVNEKEFIGKDDVLGRNVDDDAFIEKRNPKNDYKFKGINKRVQNNLNENIPKLKKIETDEEWQNF